MSSTRSSSPEASELEESFEMLQLPAELQSEVFFHLPNLASVVSLRLACRQLNKVYLAQEEAILSHLRRLLIGPFTEFYELLQRLRFPLDSIKYPPPEGWPQINPENFKAYGKTNFAVSVLKHFPYLKRSAETNIGYKSDAIDYATFGDDGAGNELEKHVESVEWLESGLEEDREENADDDDEVTITGVKHIVTIAEGHESGGICILLDTFAGMVFVEVVRCDPEARLSPREYCDMRMERIKKLEEVFYSHEETWELNHWDAYLCPELASKHDHKAMEAEGEPMPTRGGGEEDQMCWIAYLYHKFGWPGADYRKDECLAAIDDFCARWQDEEDEIYLAGNA